MTIKDFKVGQTAYILDDGRRRSNERLATAVTVVKVGRKYVTVKEEGRQEARFFESHAETSYLFEDRDYGAQRLLFLTTEAVDEYNELNSLQIWVQEATNWMKVKEYTLAQLRAVKQILEREREPEKRVYARTTMGTMPGSCTECAFGRRYGFVGDVECRILREYFTRLTRSARTNVRSWKWREPTMEAWLKKAIEAIEADAQCAYSMCKDTALKEQVELDFVLEKFLVLFRKVVEKGDDHE